MTNTIKMFPISQLVLASENPRKTRADDDIATLGASIGSLGLLHSLVGYETSDKIAITGGWSRVLAVKSLLQDSPPDDIETLANDMPVTLTTKEAALDTALSSNAVQVMMRPTEQFKAFDALSRSGVSANVIASRYFTDTASVGRILALANLSDIVFSALESGDIDLDLAKTYAGCADKARQERVFAEKRPDHAVADALREGAYVKTDPVAQLIDIETYVERGGRVHEDLFEDEIVLVDGAIVDALLEAVIAKKTRWYKSRGWAEVEFYPPSQGYFHLDWKKTQQPALVLTHDEIEELAATQANLDDLAETYGSQHWSYEEAQRETYQALTDKLRDLRSKTKFTDELKAQTRLWLSVSRNGLQKHYEMLSPAQVAAASSDDVKPIKPQFKVGYPQSFVSKASATAGNALFSYMAENPSRVARIVAIMTLNGQIAGTDIASARVADIEIPHRLPELNSILPKDDKTRNDVPTGLDRLAAMSDAQLDAQLARAVGRRFDNSWKNGEPMKPYKAIAERIGFDPSDHISFAVDTIKSMPKGQALKVLREDLDIQNDDHDAAKRGDLVKLIASTGAQQKWVPEFLRITPIREIIPKTARNKRTPPASKTRSRRVSSKVALKSGIATQKGEIEKVAGAPARKEKV
jgi:hypothetical protein